MADLTLSLGDITFTREEIPERLPFGTQQMLVTHKLVGGQRTVDAMGADFKPIEWSGWIFGPDSEARAQAIDAMAAGGLPQTLTWRSFSYQVIVRSFEPSFEKFYQIPYRIVLEVISSNTQPIVSSETPPIDQAVSDDNATADTLTQQVNDPMLSGLMATVDLMIAGLSVNVSI